MSTGALTLTVLAIGVAAGRIRVVHPGVDVALMGGGLDTFFRCEA